MRQPNSFLTGLLAGSAGVVVTAIAIGMGGGNGFNAPDYHVSQSADGRRVYLWHVFDSSHIEFVDSATSRGDKDHDDRDKDDDLDDLDDDRRVRPDRPGRGGDAIEKDSDGVREIEPDKEIDSPSRGKSKDKPGKGKPGGGD